MNSQSHGENCSDSDSVSDEALFGGAAAFLVSRLRLTHFLSGCGCGGRYVTVRAAGLHVDGEEEDGRNVQQSSSAERETRGRCRYYAAGRLRHGFPQRILRAPETTGFVSAFTRGVVK